MSAVLTPRDVGVGVKTRDGRIGVITRFVEVAASGAPGDNTGPRKWRALVRFESAPDSREAHDFGPQYVQHHDVAKLTPLESCEGK